ncbi:hypothetical protein HPB52_010840 [Rhipicephalus sanguineus]|uniref:Uncharacterized protein n=1 Tax=Rhipicephalus sanguineus TaxID=34632 RepID=A0A9D4T453_RHISA|nr:hypothetical protein HPB52_010840 [Rhipicephalus sanguineus]
MGEARWKGEPMSDVQRWLRLGGKAYVGKRLMASLQGYIYAMGGVDGNDSPFTKTVERYDVKADKWSMVAHMNDLHGFAGAGTARGRIYIAGGIGHGGLLDTVECYDPSTDVWTRVGTLSSPRAGLKVVVHMHTLYIIGGYNRTGRLTTMEQFDVMRARFSDLASMPRLNSNFAAALLEGSIYIIGGYDGKAGHL